MLRANPHSCASCGGGCQATCTAMYSDTPPGTVHRMSKTKNARGVWAAARALVFHESFPQLLDATVRRESGATGASAGALGGAGSAAYPPTNANASAAPTKFNYNWKQWICNLNTCFERGAGALPPSCERMVRVLHYYYALDNARMLGLASQLAKAVIELVYRRAEKDRLSERIGGPEINETTLMTVVRSACSHKRKYVEPLIVTIIQNLYPKVELAGTLSKVMTPTPPPPQQRPSSCSAPHSPLSTSIITSTPTTTTVIAATPVPELHTPIGDPLFSVFAPAVNSFLGAETATAANPDHLHLFPADLLEAPVGVGVSTEQNGVAANHMHAVEAISAEPHAPPLAANTSPAPSSPFAAYMANTVRDDPLAFVMQQCQLGDTVAAVQAFREALDCADQAIVGERARAIGVTPWHYMWLRLGDMVLLRERRAEQKGRRAKPATKKLLAELDVVFAEIEAEREYGEFTETAAQTLASDAYRGNFAAIATRGLLLLGADVDLGGGEAISEAAAAFADDKEREAAGLRLVLQAMDTDPWMAPLLLVRLVQNRHAPLHADTVNAVLIEFRVRAAKCSIAALHLGALLANEMANDVGYAHNVSAAASAFRDCLYGVDLPREIRLFCLRRAGRLAAFGIGGDGVDLDEADRVLSKGVEANDTFCIAHLANVRLRQRRPEDAAGLFQRLFASDEREVYISAQPDLTRRAWETYRIHVFESEEEHFLSHVRNGATQPCVMKRERAHNYGQLMVIELHELGLPLPSMPRYPPGFAEP